VSRVILDYVNWCRCALVDFVDGCEYFNQALIAYIIDLCLYTFGLMMTLNLLII